MGHSRLTALRVSDCFFERRGEPMRVLPALQRLKVRAPGDDRGLPVPPPLCQQLAGCTRLTSLSLELCALGDLPPGLSTLSALRQLALRRDDLRAAARWPDLTTLRALTRLELQRCNLARLPTLLSRCTGLRSLGLQANWDVAGDWGVLHRLTRLTVRRVGVLAVPCLLPCARLLKRAHTPLPSPSPCHTRARSWTSPITCTCSACRQCCPPSPPSSAST